MSYQVLARQWRPRTFAEVVGQQHVLQALNNALRHQRLHHAYLLSGTRGVGKTTIARILSRSLNCVTGITPEPCGQCEACVQIEQGRFVDLLEIDAASRTKVEDTREILENVQYRPTSGRYKVYLIDEVHMLSRHSFNALLKTLEEPPPHAIFLLATTEPDKLPITVLSRCLQFNLRALTREEIAGQLAHVLTAEAIPYDAAALDLLARAARGSMRDALSLTDQAIAQGDQRVQEQLVAQMLGQLDPRDNIALLNYLAQGDVEQSLQHLRSLLDRMTDISDLLAELQNLLHQLALVQCAPAYLDSGLISHKEAMQALAQRLAPEQIQVWYRMVLDGQRELPFAHDTFAAVEMVLLRLLTFRPAFTGEGIDKGADNTTEVETVLTETVTPGAGQAQKESAGLDEQSSERLAQSQVQPPVIQPSPAQSQMDTEQQQAQELAEQQADIWQQAQNLTTMPASQQVQQEVAAAMPPQQDSMDELLATREFLGQERPKVEPAPKRENALVSAIAATAGEADGLETHIAKPEEPAKTTETRTRIVELATAHPEFAALTASAEHFEFTPDTRVAAEVDSWSAIIAQLAPQGLVRQLLLHSNLQEQSAGQYELIIDAAQKTLATEQTEENIRACLAPFLASNKITITFAAVAQTPYLIQQAIDAYRLDLARQSVAENAEIALLQAALDLDVIAESIQARDEGE